MGEVLESEWGRSAKHWDTVGSLILNTVNFTILTEPGKILKIFIVITDVVHFFVMFLFFLFRILCKTSLILLLKLNDDRFLCSVLLKTFLVRKRLGRTLLCLDPCSLFGSKLFLFSGHCLFRRRPISSAKPPE